MTRDDSKLNAAGHSPRRAWDAPRLRRLATSAAEFNVSGATTDTEGFLS
jgi:hypothetical protein